MNTHLSEKKSDGERLDGLQSVEARRATSTGGEKLWAVWLTADVHALSSSRSSDQMLPPMLPQSVSDEVEPEAFDSRPEPAFFCA